MVVKHALKKPKKNSMCNNGTNLTICCKSQPYTLAMLAMFVYDSVVFKLKIILQKKSI